MPPLTRWFIKASMLSLVMALLVRAAVAILPFWGQHTLSGALAPVFFHLFVWGWVTQLIFGVAYWMFPKYSQAKPRGNETLWVAIFWSLNVGILFRVIGEPLHLIRPEALWAWLTAASAVLQWLAGMGFIINTWPRIKER